MPVVCTLFATFLTDSTDLTTRRGDHMAIINLRGPAELFRISMLLPRCFACAMTDTSLH